jgi:hypothetical protein
VTVIGEDRTPIAPVVENDRGRAFPLDQPTVGVCDRADHGLCLRVVQYFAVEIGPWDDRVPAGVRRVVVHSRKGLIR